MKKDSGKQTARRKDRCPLPKILPVFFFFCVPQLDLWGSSFG